MVRLVAGFRIEADIVEREFAETIEGDAFHETRRDDAVGINIGTGDENRAAGDGRNWIECHGGSCEWKVVS